MASALQSAGFVGFRTIEALREERLRPVPALPGVYVIVCPLERTHTFLNRSPAGWCKGRDPTLPIAELTARWVTGTCVLYIGKAGGADTRATLRSRLTTYLRHGAGHRAAHWGGRAIWQLADAEKLLVAWRTLDDIDPRAVERAELAAFVDRHGRRPFANRTS